MIQKEKTNGYSSSEDNVRNHFHNFLKESLLKIMTCIKSFKQFMVDCKEYESETKSKKRKSSKSLKSNDKGIQLNEEDEEQETKKKSNNENGKTQTDFPPIIPEEVTNIHFAQLFLSPSFQFFLQFHNENLPDLIKGRIIPGLLI